MNSELDIYKQNRIRELQTIYINNASRLYSDLDKNVKNIQSKMLISKSMKQQNINNLTKQYNANINILKNALAQAIANVNKFTPKQIEIKDNIGYPLRLFLRKKKPFFYGLFMV